MIFIISLQDILTPHSKEIVGCFSEMIYTVKPVGTGIHEITCLQMELFFFPELLSVVMFPNTFPFHASTIKQWFFKIIPVLIIEMNHHGRRPDQ